MLGFSVFLKKKNKISRRLDGGRKPPFALVHTFFFFFAPWLVGGRGEQTVGKIQGRAPLALNSPAFGTLASPCQKHLPKRVAGMSPY